MHCWPLPTLRRQSRGLETRIPIANAFRLAPASSRSEPKRIVKGPFWFPNLRSSGMKPGGAALGASVNTVG